ASMRGTTHLYAAQPDADRLPRRMTDGSCQVYGFSLANDCQTAALALATTTNPGDVYSQLVGSSQSRKLTDINGALLGEIELAQPEEISFRGPDGWEIQGWVLRPTRAAQGEKTPTILEVHGGPAAMYGWSFFFEFQLLAARGYSVVYSNPRGSTGYGRVFSGAVINDWGGKDYEDVLAGLDAAIARGGLDADRLGVAGGSYGGFMTNWAVGHSDRFKAGVTMRSVVNMATMFGVSDIGWSLTIDELSATPWDDLTRLMRFSPITYVKDIHTPLLILHSDNDLRCPIEEGEQLFSALKFLGRETKFVRFEGQSHDLSRTGHPRSRVIRFNEITGWFERFV
ncbi:MAG: S9 family peptidase, partial [Ktedonobacterales bacterium]